MSLFKFAVNTKVEVTVSMLENKNRIKNNFGELGRFLKKGKWGANSIGTEYQVLYLSKIISSTE